MTMSKNLKSKFVDICGGETLIKLNSDDNDNVLKLKVNKDTFKSIVSGKTKVYTDAISPKNLSMFFVLNEDGTVKEVKGIPQLRKYDAIQFINKEESYTCQINNADVVYMDPDTGNIIPYSELEDEDIDYTDCLISYTLGEKV